LIPVATGIPVAILIPVTIAILIPVTIAILIPVTIAIPVAVTHAIASTPAPVGEGVAVPASLTAPLPAVDGMSGTAAAERRPVALVLAVPPAAPLGVDAGGHQHKTEDCNRGPCASRRHYNLHSWEVHGLCQPTGAQNS
jgi:hypothetical protein